MKINSKWMKYLSIRSAVVSLLEEKRGLKLLDIRLGRDFFIFFWSDTKSISNKRKKKQVRNSETTSN